MAENNSTDTRHLSADLRNKGKEQLQSEIKILEEWLEELDETRDDNTESINARKNYLDMLQSRKDLLELLK